MFFIHCMCLVWKLNNGFCSWFKKIKSTMRQGLFSCLPFHFDIGSPPQHWLARRMTCLHSENSQGSSFDSYRMVQLFFCVEMRALTLQWFLFPPIDMLWAGTTEVRRGQRRKENSLGMERERARQTHWGERCHPISYCIFKQEYTGDGPSRIASLCSKRQEQSSSYIPGLKSVDIKTDEGPLSRYCS